MVNFCSSGHAGILVVLLINLVRLCIRTVIVLLIKFEICYSFDLDSFYGYGHEANYGCLFHLCAKMD